jgi:hypothetical protein
MKTILEFQEPKPTSVDWQSNDKSRILPLDSQQNCVQHFALGVIPLEVWDDPTKSLTEKFQNGRFWELDGPELQPKEGD